MNRYLLLCLMAIVLLTTVGCRPRHPPIRPNRLAQRPRPVAPSSSLDIEDLRTVASAQR